MCRFLCTGNLVSQPLVLLFQEHVALLEKEGRRPLEFDVLQAVQQDKGTRVVDSSLCAALGEALAGWPEHVEIHHGGRSMVPTRYVFVVLHALGAVQLVADVTRTSILLARENELVVYVAKFEGQRFAAVASAVAPHSDPGTRFPVVANILLLDRGTLLA